MFDMFIRLYTESSTSSSSRSSKLSRGQRKGNRLFFPAPVARSKFRLLNLLCPKILASTLSRFLRKRKRDSCDHRYFVPNFREIRCFLCTVDFCDDERRKTYRHITKKNRGDWQIRIPFLCVEPPWEMVSSTAAGPRWSHREKKEWRYDDKSTNIGEGPIKRQSFHKCDWHR